MKFVVSYDIEDDKKRKKISKILSQYGIRVQFSVFECKISKTEMKELTEKLDELIKTNADSVIFYPQCENCDSKKSLLGASYLERRISVIEI